MTIELVLSESNYYRNPASGSRLCASCSTTLISISARHPPPSEPLWQLCQVYLRYQDPPRRNTTFKIDDSALIENGFTCCDTYPNTFAGDTLTLTSTNSLGIKVYSDNLTNTYLVVGLGQSFGKDWILVVSDESNIMAHTSWEAFIKIKYLEMKTRMPAHARHVNKVRSGVEQVCITQTRLPRTTRILQISSVMWKTSRTCGVKLEAFDDPGFGDVSGEWTAFNVNVSSYFVRHSGTNITIYLGNRRSRL